MIYHKVTLFINREAATSAEKAGIGQDLSDIIDFRRLLQDENRNEFPNADVGLRAIGGAHKEAAESKNTVLDFYWQKPEDAERYCAYVQSSIENKFIVAEYAGAVDVDTTSELYIEMLEHHKTNNTDDGF